MALFFTGHSFYTSFGYGFLDGAIARKYQLITTFGKLADPLADKMLVFTAMTVLMMDGFIPMWVYIVILIREFMVSGIRMVVIEKGTVIAAAKLGKWKTFVTMVAIIVLFSAVCMRLSKSSERF